MTKNLQIAYLIPEFPQQTHAFFWREMQGVAQTGAQISIVSTRKPDLGMTKHSFAEAAAAKTHYLHPPKWHHLLYPLLHPVWLVRCLRYAFSAKGGLRTRVELLYFILVSSSLLKYCTQKHISHVHGHSCANVAHLLALAELSKKVTYSLTLHGGLSTYGTNHDLKFRNAKFVATVTRPLQQDVIELTGFDKNKVPVIPMGVNLEKFGHQEREYPQEGAIRFITVARLALGKGHRFSLEALVKLQDAGYDFSYTIVGTGPDAEAIKETVQALNLSAKVRFTGTLDEDNVAKELYNADALLLTSYGGFEAAPVCVMEAMASGIPTITSIIGGTRDMIKHENNGFLVEQKNVEQIFNAMLRLAENRDLLRQMGVAAREFALENFDYRTQAKRLAECMASNS